VGRRRRRTRRLIPGVVRGPKSRAGIGTDRLAADGDPDPIAVTWCPICGSGVVCDATDDGLHAFERPGFALRVEDGTVRGDGATWTPATGESDDGRRELVRRVAADDRDSNRDVYDALEDE
jgi:hypothetical protein